MAYDRYDEDRARQRGHYPDRDRERGYRAERDRRGDRERGFFERAGDEVSSWFGDEEAERRRHRDAPRSDRDEWFGGRGDDERSDHDRPRGYGGGERSGGYRPMAGDYGRRGRDEGRGDSAGFGDQRDRAYADWRRRHLAELDRDYDAYRRENQSKFHEDFGDWRSRREGKRGMLRDISEHMEVVGKDGERVGKVDCVAGDRIILTKSGPESGGRHHSIGCALIDRVEKDKLLLEVDASEARKRWRDEDRERALFEREDQGEGGPHMLDRSFSGTYR